MPVKKMVMDTVTQFYYLCDECGKGRLKHTGVALPTTPVKYIHKCTKCNMRVMFEDIKYPYLKRNKIQPFF